MKEEARPVEAMRELDPETRAFLDSLSEEDRVALKSGIVFMRRVESFSIVLRWLAIGLVTIVVGASTLWDSISALLRHIRH